MPAEQLQQCVPSGNPSKKCSGIGMPTSLYLQQFGSVLYHAFDGEVAYQVGSSLTSLTWRDVDVRILLPSEKYKTMGFGDPANPHSNAKWCAFVTAFSELGRKMTGLPIDFQIQDQDVANAQYSNETGHPRSALFRVIESRIA